MFTTPAGQPASARTSAKTLASSGVSGAGLRMMTEPEAMVGPTLREVMNSGTFQGMIPAHTPTGSRRTMIVPPRAPSRCSSKANSRVWRAKASNTIDDASTWPNMEK